MARTQRFAAILLAALALLSLASAVRVPHGGLFASAIDLPAGAHIMLSTRMSELVQRRQLGEGSAAGYGYGGYSYGYDPTGYGHGYGYGYGPVVPGYYHGYGF